VRGLWSRGMRWWVQGWEAWHHTSNRDRWICFGCFISP
jgi:hypothetical protein